MKKWLLVTLCLGQFLISRAQPVDYDSYFTPERLRVDLVFTGNARQQDVFLHSLHKEQLWTGSKTRLAVPFSYGEYQYKVYASNNLLLFSKGFNSLFSEWITTQEALEKDKAFSTSLWMPFPKEPVLFEISRRVAQTGKWVPLKTFRIDPKDQLIREEKPVYTAEALLQNGPVENHVDLLFVAEGYRAGELDKFRKDAARFAQYLFEYEPFKSRKTDFNIWILPLVSEDSGPSLPQHDFWAHTALYSAFHTFYLERYLTLPDFSLLAKAVSGAPFDALFVLVNSTRYGGGGIYNYYGIGTSDHPLSKEVFVHEFGHSFAGLADEYYESEVAYLDMYPTDVEPWEANITTRVDFASKWEDMMDIPGVGLFEGAAYMAKGMYRPAEDCRMHTNRAPAFCPVCQRAIERIIDYFTK
jgi:hypothetical protein